MEIDGLVADILEQIIANNQRQLRQDTAAFIKFQSSYIPEVTVASYLARIRRYSKCSDACLVLTLVYVDRAIETKGLLLSALNIHRLIIVAVMLAAKFHEDLFYNNAFYAQLGGLNLIELNSLEVELLTALDYGLHVDAVTYSKYSDYLTSYAKQRTLTPPVCSPRGVSATGCDNAFQFSPFAGKRYPQAHQQQAAAAAMGALLQGPALQGAGAGGLQQMGGMMPYYHHPVHPTMPLYPSLHNYAPYHDPRSPCMPMALLSF